MELLQTLAHFATILEAIAITASVYFIWYEVHENNRLARAANSNRLITLSSPLAITTLANQWC